MDALKNLTMDDDIKDSGDKVGSNFSILDSALYRMKIKLAYFTKSKGEALALNVHGENTKGVIIRQPLWITSGKKKGKKNFYLDKEGNKNYLPGFIQANALCELIIGKPLNMVETTQKVIELYDPATKSMVATNVEMLMDLVDTEIVAGIIKVKSNKNAKDPKTDKYVPTAEIREENEIDKFFRLKDGMTLTEVKANAQVATFKDTWIKHWDGKVKDKTVSADKIPVLSSADSDDTIVDPFA